MTAGIMVAGNYYEYSDSDWEKLQRGDLETFAPILCAVIKRQAAEIQQWKDEWSYLTDFLDQAAQENRDLRAANEDLGKQQALGWESKPAKAAKAKKALERTFGTEMADALVKGTPFEQA